MAISVNTNVASLEAQRNLQRSTSGVAATMQRLSTGLRINSAADDAAGLAIASRLTSQVGGYAAAQRNANDGVSLVQAGAGALEEQGSLLARLRELAVQSTNGTLGQVERSYLDREAQQLTAEVDRIARTTEFNGAKLLDGSGGGATFQVGIVAGGGEEAVSVKFGDATAQGLGIAGMRLDTPAGARQAIEAIDGAVASLSTSRSAAGAAMTRLQSAWEGAASARVSASEARARIQDSDVAAEASARATSLIRQQAGTAMLAQANKLPDALLALLKG